MAGLSPSRLSKRNQDEIYYELGLTEPRKQRET